MITVIGLDGSPLRPQAVSALTAATLVVGGRRHLDATAAYRPQAVTTPPGQAAAGPDLAGPVRSVVLGPLAPAMEALATHDGNAVVLASGDPGFFGIVRALRERGLVPEVQPAVSSVAQAFARAGLPWDDAVVVSAHGRDLRRAVNVCRAYPKVAVLTGPGHGPGEIGAALAGWPRRLLVAEALGSPAERITECPATGAAGRSWADPNVVLVLASPPALPAAPPAPAGRTGGQSRWCWPPDRAGTAEWALAEEAFEHRDSMVTKAEVRALALARLGPRPGDLIWDVGAGSGAVAVECARFGAAVIAVDRDPAQCARISRNAARHGTQVRVAGGEAPGVLAGLPDPDAVFVGGGGTEVVAAVAERQPARIVVALAAVERAGPVIDALDTAGYPVSGSLLQAARLAPLPDGTHRLAAANPVFVLWAAR